MLLNGTTSRATTAGLGGVSGSFGAITMASIVRRNAAGVWTNVIGIQSAANASLIDLTIDSSNRLQLETTGGSSTGPTLSPTTGPMYVAGDKATGNVAARLHKQIYGTDAAVAHSAGAGAIVPSGTPAKLCIGTFDTASDWFNGDIFRTAIWNRQLADWEHEWLAADLNAWFLLNPDWMIMGDWATLPTAIPDVSANGGAPLTTLTNISPSTNGIPIGHGAGVLLETRAPSASGINGDGSPSLGALSLTATGLVLVQGAASPSLGTLALTSAGLVLVQGAASPTLGILASTAAGKVDVQGSGSPSLGSLALSAAGVNIHNGAGAPSLGALACSSAGTVLVQGASAPSLGTLTSSSTGAVLVQGTGSPSLGTLALSADGSVTSSGINGAGSPTLGSLSCSSTGAVLVKGAAAPTLATLTESGAGTVVVSGTGSQALGALTLSATGTVGSTPIIGDGSPLLGSLSLVSTGKVNVVGAGSPLLEVLALSATGHVPSLNNTTTVPGWTEVQFDRFRREHLMGKRDFWA